MTSRHRILMSLNHEEPDRCPNYIWINDDARNKLRIPDLGFCPFTTRATYFQV